MVAPFRPAADVPPSPDTPPRRPGRPRGSGGGRRSSKSLRSGIDGLLVVVNTIVAQVRPHDALDATELATLGKAIDEQAKQSPRFRRALESMLNVTGGTSLIPVVAIIGARRLARHGMIPRPVDPLGSVVLQMMQAEPSEAAAAMAQIQAMMQGVRAGGDSAADADAAATD
jgi:hypothetical protein